MIWVIIASVVLPQFAPTPAGSKSPIEFCYRELGIVERPSTAAGFIKMLDSPEFRKCLTWAPSDTDAHVHIPSAMELLGQPTSR